MKSVFGDPRLDFVIKLVEFHLLIVNMGLRYAIVLAARLLKCGGFL